jgi:nitrite reductase/ring-hydroxylating ferredoxin subunit
MDPVPTAPAAEGGWLRVVIDDYAVEIPAKCPHRGAPLARGTLFGFFLQCPWHGATFDLRTGARLRGPLCDDLPIRPCLPAESGSEPASGRAERRTA